MSRGERDTAEVSMLPEHVCWGQGEQPWHCHCRAICNGGLLMEGRRSNACFRHLSYGSYLTRA